MHSNFFYHAAAAESTVVVDGGGLGDVVRGGGGRRAFEDQCVVMIPPLQQTAAAADDNLPNDDELFMGLLLNHPRPPIIANYFQDQLLSTGGGGAVKASAPMLLPRPTTTTRPPAPPRAAVPSLSSSTASRVPGISKKSRKGQAKKVVCVPAPAADQESNNKANVVVPSDLWAWRKYGQKPIKGSPYPRGYYRCSSSKGCLARKQVERSPSDPTMLVITYTAEHNHPWPTQRNSLAGSSRSSSSSHPIKNHTAAAAAATNMHVSQSSSTKHVDTSDPPALDQTTVKEEIKWESTLEQIFSTSCYQPHLQTTLDQLAENDLDFFAELGGLDPDPVSLFSSSSSSRSDINVAIGDRLQQLEGSEQTKEELLALDHDVPLSLLDWDIDGN